jgi:hypothetical protein
MTVLGVLLLFTAGCGNADSAGATSTPSAWEKAQHPYTIVGVTRANVPRVREQKRLTQLIVPAPKSQAEILSAVQEAYDALTSEIRVAQADAEYRSVAITVFDSREDLELDPKGWLCRLVLSPAGGEKFPSKVDDVLAWQWRDPGQAPSKEDRQLEWNYLKELREVDRAAAFGVTDAELVALDGVQRREFYEKRYPDDASAIKEDLAAEAKLDVPRVQAILDRVLHWKFPDPPAEQTSVKAP